MSTVDAFIHDFRGHQKEIMLYLHDLLTEEMNLTPKIRYRIPFYYGKSWVCYINPTKDGNVEFAFPRGNELSNVQGLLQAKERKQVRSLEFVSLDDIPEDAVRAIIQEAIVLDESVPYASKRKASNKRS